MGVCLYFTSDEPVDPRVEEAIRNDTAGRADHQPWILCEPPYLERDGRDGRLRGRAKLNLIPDPDEFAEASRIEVERNDLEEVIRRLCEWSGRHGLTWQVTVDGEKLGAIRQGVCEHQLMDAAQAMAGLAVDLGQLAAEEFEGEDGGDDAGPSLCLWSEPD